MREIKFRAWDKERRRMIGSDYPGNWGNSEEEVWDDIDKMAITSIEAAAKDDSLVLMQYTCFKDESGKEIYDGDIVEVAPAFDDGSLTDDIWKPGTRWGVRWGVGWGGDREVETWVLADIGSPYFDDNEIIWDDILASPDDSPPVRIIGNIYDNPELLSSINSPTKKP